MSRTITTEQVVERVFLGESLVQIAAAYREERMAEVGLDPRESLPETFEPETTSFMKALCRHLGERHAGDRRVLVALREWVRVTDHYEAWDALLTHFDFDGKDALIRRGRVLFAGPMTAHWRA